MVIKFGSQIIHEIYGRITRRDKNYLGIYYKIFLFIEFVFIRY